MRARSREQKKAQKAGDTISSSSSVKSTRTRIISIIIILFLFILCGLFLFLTLQRFSKKNPTLDKNEILSSEIHSTGEYESIRCEKTCEATLSIHSLCQCLTNKINKLMNKIDNLKKKPKDEKSITTSFHKFATHSLILEKIPLDEDNIMIIKNATLFAKNLNLKNFNLKDLLEIHRLVMIKDETIAGKIRKEFMFVPNKGSTEMFIQMPPPNELEGQLQQFFAWFSKEVHSNMNPIIFASMAKLFLIRIHPFGDGNGRTSRILFNVILQKIIPFWVNVPANEIVEYYDAIGEVEVGLDLNPYITYLVNCVINSFDQYVEDAKITFH